MTELGGAEDYKQATGNHHPFEHEGAAAIATRAGLVGLVGDGQEDFVVDGDGGSENRRHFAVG
jgi:hypothetical protein